jgi:hypothetical protein
MWVACVHWNVMAYNIRASPEELFFLPDRNWDLTSRKGDLTGDSDKLRIRKCGKHVTMSYSMTGRTWMKPPFTTFLNATSARKLKTIAGSLGWFGLELCLGTSNQLTCGAAVMTLAGAAL